MAKSCPRTLPTYAVYYLLAGYHDSSRRLNGGPGPAQSHWAQALMLWVRRTGESGKGARIAAPADHARQFYCPDSSRATGTHLFPLGQMWVFGSELVVLHALDFFLCRVYVGPCCIGIS